MNQAATHPSDAVLDARLQALEARLAAAEQRAARAEARGSVENLFSNYMGWWCSAFFLGQFVSPVFVTIVRSWTGSLLNAFVVCGALCILFALSQQLLGRRSLATLRPS